jgi:hypothetical protein
LGGIFLCLYVNSWGNPKIRKMKTGNRNQAVACEEEQRNAE